MTRFLLYCQPLSPSSRKFRRGEITTLIRLSEIIRDLQRAPTSAISRAVDSRSGDCGNDGVLLYYQLPSLSSRKFRRGEITTLIRLSEIIRDLQRAQTSAILRVADSRSRDCGNDGFLLLRAQTSAILRAVDSRSRDCGNDEVLLYYQPPSLSSRKFRRGEITTLIRFSEIIRDLQRVQMLAILRAIDSRSRDSGNDEVLL
jgi:hypothetical protein